MVVDNLYEEAVSLREQLFVEVCTARQQQQRRRDDARNAMHSSEHAEQTGLSDEMDEEASDGDSNGIGILPSTF